MILYILISINAGEIIKVFSIASNIVKALILWRIISTVMRSNV